MNEIIVRIMMILYKTPNASIEEISKDINKSFSNTHRYLRKAEELKVITSPKEKNIPRDRKLTALGLEYLKENHYVR